MCTAHVLMRFCHVIDCSFVYKAKGGGSYYNSYYILDSGVKLQKSNIAYIRIILVCNITKIQVKSFNNNIGNIFPHYGSSELKSLLWRR